MVSLTERLNRAFYARQLAREVYLRIGQPARYECNWVTIGGQGNRQTGKREGGAPVCIDDRGIIEKGPKGLQRRSIKKLTQGPSKREQAIRESAASHGVGRKELSKMVDAVWAEERELSKEREAAKRLAREMTGMTERDVARIENSGRDHSTVPRFDEVADEIANTYPGILDGDDPSAALWDLLREGKHDLPAKHDPAIVDAAAERILAAQRREENDVEFTFGGNVESEFFGRVRTRMASEVYARLRGRW